MFMFILVLVLWGCACVSYWLFRSMKTRRYNGYAAGRLDTMYVVFMLMTLALLVAAVITVWGQ
jgi:hypothetical protein